MLEHLFMGLSLCRYSYQVNISTSHLQAGGASRSGKCLCKSVRSIKRSLTWESFRLADNYHLKGDKEPSTDAFFSSGHCPQRVLLVTASNRPAMPVTQWDVSQPLKGSSLFHKLI